MIVKIFVMKISQGTQWIVFLYTLFKMSNLVIEVNSASLIEVFSFKLVHCIGKRDTQTRTKAFVSKENLIAMPLIRLTIKIKILSKILNPSIHESSALILC